MLNKKKESESWEITLWEYLVFYLNLDGRKKRTKKRYDMLSRFIRTLLSTQKKEMIEKIMNDEELWEYLRNPIHISVKNRIEYVLQKMRRSK